VLLSTGASIVNIKKKKITL